MSIAFAVKDDAPIVAVTDPWGGEHLLQRSAGGSFIGTLDCENKEGELRPMKYSIPAKTLETWQALEI